MGGGMTTIVLIPAGSELGVGATIRSLFDDVGIPGYFTMAPEIPNGLFDEPVPERAYSLFLCDKVPRDFLIRNDLRHPSPSESLWAIGCMNALLAEAICQSDVPVRFLHTGFRSEKHHYHMFPNATLRQLVVRRSQNGFEIGTVRPGVPYDGFRLVYVRQ